MPPKSSCVVPLTSCGRPARSALNRSNAAVVEREDVVLRRLDQEQPLQLRELLGLLLREVVRLRPVVRAVELPDVLVERRPLGRYPRRAVAGDRGPALVVDAAVAEHLEVLRLAALRRVGVVERVGHRDAVQRHLLDAVDEGRLRQPGGVEHGRGDVDHVVELGADLALGLDASRPVDDRAVARAAPVRGDLLRPLVGRVHRVRPADRVVVVRLRRAEVVDALGHELDRLEPERAVQDDQLVEAAVRRALGRGAVVADDHVDQRVVEDLEVFERVDQRVRRGGRCARGSPRRPPSAARRSASCRRASRPRRGSPPAAPSAPRPRG